MLAALWTSDRRSLLLGLYVEPILSSQLFSQPRDAHHFFFRSCSRQLHRQFLRYIPFLPPSSAWSDIHSYASAVKTCLPQVAELATLQDVLWSTIRARVSNMSDLGRSILSPMTLAILDHHFWGPSTDWLTRLRAYRFPLKVSERMTDHGSVPHLNARRTHPPGSSVKIYGTIGTRDVVGPWWECYVDGQSISRSAPIRRNNLLLCEYETNEPGVHTLSVNVTSNRRRFWLDYIEYDSSPTDSAEHSFVRIQDNDPTLRYDTTWIRLEEEGGAHLTRDIDGAMITTFNGKNASPSSLKIEPTNPLQGTGLIWYGFIPNNMARGASSGSYSIDGGPPTTFILTGPDNGARGGPSQYNQKFFETPDLPLGTHTIKVTYHGSNTPLTLQNLVVFNKPQSIGVQTVTIASEPTASPNTASQSPSSSPPVGTIVGAVVGTLIILIILVLAFFFGRRWYRRRTLPTIAPLPGFVKPNQPMAPLDIDAVPQRYSVELEERYAAHQQSPRFHLGHLRPPRVSRQFNPEVRSTMSSIDLNPPPVQHAPPSTSNAETDSILTAPRSSVVDLDAPPRPLRNDSSARGSQLDPYSAGYPYANMGLSEYQKLVAATKAEEARLHSSRRRDPGYM